MYLIYMYDKVICEVVASVCSVLAAKSTFFIGNE